MRFDPNDLDAEAPDQTAPEPEVAGQPVRQGACFT
jgi:hypothetical protein